VILQEATLVAGAMQERSLTNALELYWLNEGAYPDVADQAVVSELYDAGLLKSEEVVYDVDYIVTPDRQRYELTVS